MKITQERLKQLLHYSPDDGQFRWLVKAVRKVNIGDVAGCVSSIGYVQISVDKKLHLAHRLAFLYVTGEFPVNDVDHINCDKSDNRWVNLREATRQQNVHNTGIRGDNTSGKKGVYWHSTRGKWVAQVQLSGERIHLGLFKDIVDAAKAYDDFVIKNHKHFYNKPKDS